MNGHVRPESEEARVLQVIELGAKRGRGTTDDPMRIATVYRTLDGQFLAEVDPVKEAKR